MSEKTILTREGYEKLKKELDRLKTSKRKEIADDIARAGFRRLEGKRRVRRGEK